MQNQTKNDIRILAEAFLKVLGVAGVLGIAGYVITNDVLTGISVFIAAIVLQFAANSIAVGATLRKNKKAEFLALQVLKEASERKLPYVLKCAYCRKENNVGISFNSDIEFICAECKQPNRVFIQFTTARMTTPLTVNENINYIDIENTNSNTSQSTINEPIVFKNE